MAMIECPECKKQISDQAPTCINCGVPITQQQQPPPEQYQTHIQQQPILYQPVQHGHVMGEKVKKPIFKKWWFWLIIAIGIIIIIAASSSGGGSTPSAAPMPDPAQRNLLLKNPQTSNRQMNCLWKEHYKMSRP